MPAELNDARMVVLRALCDTFVPSITVENDSTGFWARTASDVGVPEELSRHLLERLPEEIRRGLLGVLDALAALEFVGAPQVERESILKQLSGSFPELARGISFYEKQVLLLAYGLPAEPVPDAYQITYGSPHGQNPNWEVLGYPGPVSIPRPKPKQIGTITPEGALLALDADVCVVGSGAGGSVIAARLAERGRSVVVLEAGGHYNSADFHQLELWGYRHLWYKGGATPTIEGNVLLLAGGALGGGTEINWMNCVRTPDIVRRDWSRDFGLDGVDTADFDRYQDTVEERLLSSSRTAYYNDQNLRMKEGCERLGYLSKQTHVNWDPELFNPLMAGYTGFGDQSGGKQTARRTYLLDAYRNGARFVVHCRADRIMIDDGRAVGVEATYADPHGRTAQVVIQAPQVVLACGALESPALLLRSGFGGPAVGEYLRVQPGGAVYGVYKEKQRGWWGSPMTANCEQFTDTGDGFGFYMEIPAFGPGFVASVIPWTTGRQHKEVMTKVPYISTFIWFLRDKGYGRVTIDATGNSAPAYALVDETDQANFRRASVEAIRIHDAAGAEEILFSVGNQQLAWKRGRTLEDFIQLIVRQPLNSQPMISAHQLCTCRMGKDPRTSVANTDGELHDVKGVWVGDASACPTALGANPMITIMALAERTADKMCRSSEEAVGTTRRTRTAREAFLNVGDSMVNPMNIFSAMAEMLMAPLNMLAQGNAAPRDASRYDDGRREPADTLSWCHPSESAGPWAAPAAGAREDAVAADTRSTTMFSHLIELTVKAGCAEEVVSIIRNRAIPDIIEQSPGFVEQIVLLSDTDPNRVIAISFWRSKDDARRFTATGFAKVTSLLASLLAAPPERREFGVGSSTNPRIRGSIQ